MSRPPTGADRRLFDCALTLFARNGYAATSVREIIEAVGLTKPVLYYYCENKADLFAKLIERVHGEAYRELEELVASDKSVTKKLAELIRGSFAFCRADPRIPRLMFQASFGPELPEIRPVLQKYESRRYELIRGLMMEGTAKGALSGDIDVLAVSFCALMDYPISLFSRDQDQAENLTSELAAALHAVFLHGAQAPAPAGR